MRIHAVGASFHGGQVDRIQAGFVALGHELSERMDDADLLYANDSNHYIPILNAYSGGRLKPTARIVFNVLDIPEHNLADYDLAGLDKQLSHAHAVTSISAFVHDQLIRYLQRDSSIIYQPVKPITRNPEPRSDRYARFLSVGRRSDPNKNHRLGVQALQILGIHYGQLGLVGDEYGGWGEYLGVLTDQQLNQAYNSVDFVFALGKCEGLCLPLLEGMAAGVIPIACTHLSTLKELLPPDLFPEYGDVAPSAVSVSRFVARYMQDNGAMEDLKARLYAHYTATWKDRVSPVAVAAAILKVYEGVKP